MIKIGKKNILTDANCYLEKGKITAILGGNGAGKSTLLKALTGILKPNTGNIFLEDKNLNQFSLTDLAKKRAVLSQNLHINFPFTVEEIVEMGLEIFNYSENSKKEIINDSLKLVEVDHLKKRIFSTLSGGEQQRVNIARVLSQIWQRRNSYLFFDEPTSALDLKYQHLLMQITQKLRDEIGLTILIIIHDINLAHHYSDNLILMKNTKIFISGKTKSVFNKKNLSATFNLGESALNKTLSIF
jgi:iron complex transport system ATP-binding protein